ncbi:MAG: peptidylprolyl isomerase [Anaerolineaceae bacterium]|nr:peptidylprolyl isomerase [Anaerolineaceae bacterium]
MIVPVASAQDAQTPAAICESAVATAVEPETRTFTQAEQVLEPNVDYHAILCTEVGPVYVDLLEESAPETVNNFVFLAQNNYYNNTTFHRVIADFMAQGGDPTGTGTGGPGYQFDDEFVGYWTFDRPGLLAMANAGAGTNGSQFFITTVPTPHLDFLHTIFGVVLDGQQNVEAIRLRDPQTDTESGTLLQTVVIVTDPSTVQTDTTAPEAATAEDVALALAGIQDLLPADLLAVDEANSGVLDIDQVVAAAPESVQTDLNDTLSAHGFEYRATNTVVNSACNLENVIFTAISYTLDAFPTREDAAAALASGIYGQVAEAQGLTANDSPNLDFPYYTAEITGCDAPALRTETHWQRGRFVVTAAVDLSATDLRDSADLVLSVYVGLRIYEPVLADIFRSELH